MKPRDAIIVMKSRTGISLFYSRLDLFSHSFRKYLVPDEILNGELLRDSSIKYIYIQSWEDKEGKFTIGDDGKKYTSSIWERKQGPVFYFVSFVTALIVISYRTIVTDSKLQLK